MRLHIPQVSFPREYLFSKLKTLFLSIGECFEYRLEVNLLCESVLSQCFMLLLRLFYLLIDPLHLAWVVCISSQLHISLSLDLVDLLQSLVMLLQLLDLSFQICHLIVHANYHRRGNKIFQLLLHRYDILLLLIDMILHSIQQVILFYIGVKFQNQFYLELLEVPNPHLYGSLLY